MSCNFFLCKLVLQIDPANWSCKLALRDTVLAEADGDAADA